MRRFLTAAGFLFCAAPLRAQIPDARLVPSGAFRWSFTPSWVSWDRYIIENGNERLLDSYASSDSAGADIFPTLAASDNALRTITQNSTFRVNLGKLKTALDNDRRTFPFEFSVGTGSRLTLSATVPIIVTRVQATVTLDSTLGNSGWNPLLTLSGIPNGATDINQFLNQLDNGITSLSSRIAAGTALCGAQAPAILARAQATRAAVATLYGVG